MLGSQAERTNSGKGVVEGFVPEREHHILQRAAKLLGLRPLRVSGFWGVGFSG